MREGNERARGEREDRGERGESERGKTLHVRRENSSHENEFLN